MECSMSWTEDSLVLTLYYSSAISIKRAWTCPILSSTDVTHIHWLPNHISGISNKALVLVRDVKNVHVTDGHFDKECFETYKQIKTPQNGMVQ